MDVKAVFGELGTKLRTITGLRVYEYGTAKVDLPAAVIHMADMTINYHANYGTGQATFEDVVVMVLVRDTARRQSFSDIAAYVKPYGSKSIKNALENATYTAMDVVTVNRVEFDSVTWNGADYLAALFHLDIVGTGA